MDRVELYLQVVPLPVLLIVPVVALAAFLLIPSRYRMPVALSLMMVWLPMSEYADLGMIQAVSKTTGFAAYILVAVTAWLDPGPRRPLSVMAWMYPATALLGFMYIWTVSDFAMALVIRVQWLMLVIAALAVARTIVDEASLLRVLRALTVGLALALAVPLSDLVMHPGTAFKYGMRFAPYDMNSNHTGVLFAMAAPFTIYVAMRSSRAMWRVLLISVAAVGMGMALLTVSRSTLVVMLGMLFPMTLVLTRRPIITALAAIILVGGLYWTIGKVATVNFGRLSTIETQRVPIFREYLGVIAERPLLGLLETEGESFHGTQTLANPNPHNGYIHALYFGGISYALPLFSIVAYTGLCTFRVWRKRRLIAADPLLINLLVAFMVMAYAHGFVNPSLYYPTTTLAFPHVLFSAFFMGLAGDLQQRSRGGLPLGYETSGWLYPDDDEPLDDEAAEYAA